MRGRPNSTDSWARARAASSAVENLSSHCTESLEYDFDRIIGYTGMLIDRLNTVRWYGFAPKDEIVEEQHHAPKYFIA